MEKYRCLPRYIISIVILFFTGQLLSAELSSAREENSSNWDRDSSLSYNEVILSRSIMDCGGEDKIEEASLIDQLGLFINGLTDTSYWPARWECGYWTQFHGWFYLLSDTVIFLAYLAIPIVLLIFLRKRRDIVFKKIFFLFAAFILLCGLTHFIDAIAFWVPAYALNGLVKFVTAIVSIGTVFALINILPYALRLRSPIELEQEIAQRKLAEKNLENKLKELERVNELMVDRELKMIELKKNFNQLKNN